MGGRRPAFTAEPLGARVETPEAPLVQPPQPAPTTGLPGPLMPEPFGLRWTSARGGVAAGDGDWAWAGMATAIRIAAMVRERAEFMGIKNLGHPERVYHAELVLFCMVFKIVCEAFS
jgi:hypothetical protein